MNTIRRQYSLPNCTLILEGLNNLTPGDSREIGRPLLSIVVNAECIFTGSGQRLSGGREFLESLVKSASAYAQEFLSGIHHPSAHHASETMVSFVKGEDPHLHHLSWHPNPEKNGAEVASQTVEVALTTVQLFDLVEAIDQLLADNRTLPDLALTLEPVSRRYRQADVPIVQRTAPALLGLSGLAVAGVLFFLVPIPQEVPEPKPVQEEQVEDSPSPDEPTAGSSPTPEETPIAEESPTPEDSPLAPEEIQDLLAGASQLEDPTTLSYLERSLRGQLDEAWADRDEVDRDLEYRVSVTQGGSIVKYEPIDDTPENAEDNTPLPKLRYTPTRLGETEEIADFRVVFKNNSILQISPWFGDRGAATYGPEIEDSEVLGRLNGEVKEKILEAWLEMPGSPSFTRDLEFRVGVTEEGEIADYEPENQPAFDYIEETPLRDLVEPEAAGIEIGKNVVPQQPLGQFRVVFTPNQGLEVSPLRGF